MVHTLFSRIRRMSINGVSDRLSTQIHTGTVNAATSTSPAVVVDSHPHWEPWLTARRSVTSEVVIRMSACQRNRPARSVRDSVMTTAATIDAAAVGINGSQTSQW